MTTIQIGYDAAGNPLDYTTFAAYTAACGVAANLPTSMTEVIYVEVWYADASQGNHFDEIYDAYTFIDNDFYIAITGMFGSFIDRSCPMINQMITTTTNDRTRYRFENLAFGTDETTWSVDLAKWTQESRFICCNLLGGYSHPYGDIYLENCFVLINTNGYGVSTGRININKCIISQKGAGYAYRYTYGSMCYNSTIYSNRFCFYSTSYAIIVNSIFYSLTLTNSSTYSSGSAFTMSNFNNSCFYQTDYPTKFIFDYSFEEVFGVDNGHINANSIIGDPKFVNTSGTMSEIADFALAEDSPCRYDNRTAQNNDLFPANKEELTTIGAWSYFEPPTLDYPTITDVRKDVVYENGDKTGTAYIPSADDTRNGVNVDNTIGNLVVPSGEQVQDGVFFDSNSSVEGTYDNSTNPDYILASASGNWYDFNLVSSGVRYGVFYGIGASGSYDNSTNPSGVIKSYGGLWNDDYLSDQLDFINNVKVGASGGISWSGGYIAACQDPAAPQNVSLNARPSAPNIIGIS